VDGVRLEIERSGGFGGLLLRGSFEVAQLSPRQRAALEAVLGRTMRASGPAELSGPDRFTYQVRLGDQEVLVPEAELPEPLRPLVQGLSPDLQGFNKAPS
jgi:hypothetical protein